MPVNYDPIPKDLKLDEVEYAYSVGSTGIRYVTADYRRLRITFTVTVNGGLQFQATVSDIAAHDDRLPAIALAAARFYRRHQKDAA